MITAREVVGEVLAALGWKHETSDELRLMRLGFTGRHGRWLGFIKWNAAGDQVVVYAVSPVAMTPERRDATLEYVTRANLGLPAGCFELDLDNGEVRFRRSVDWEGTPPDAAQVRLAILTAMAAMDQYLPGLVQVVQQRGDPQQALRDVEG